MNTGMLWFDNDPKTGLDEKVIRAVTYYTEKYGQVPNLCLIHPNALDGNAGDSSKSTQSDISGITIRTYRSVLPGHLWIGVETKN